MSSSRALAGLPLLLLALAGPARAQAAADAVPEGPFKTVHLMAVAPAQEAGLQAAVREFNDAFRRSGCAACAYHLLHMTTGSQSPYNTLVYADWPSRSEYLRLHDSDAYAAVGVRHPEFEALQAQQFYGRFVESR